MKQSNCFQPATGRPAPCPGHAAPRPPVQAARAARATRARRHQRADGVASVTPGDEHARRARIAGMGELVVSIAHEIEQPLAAATLNLRAALHTYNKSEAHADAPATLRAALQACEQASAIVHGIGALARRQTPRAAPCDIGHCWQALLPLLAGELQRQRIRVRLDLCPQARTVRADGVQLQQVLLNLATNAIAAMAGVDGRARELTIRSRAASDESGAGAVQLSLIDSGTGLAPAACRRVFARLYTNKAGGMGMGLRLCRALVESHGGRIWAEARPAPEHGSVFHVLLPAMPSAPLSHSFSESTDD